MSDYIKILTSKDGIKSFLKKPVILLYGDQDLLIDEILDKIVKESVAPGFEDFDYIYFNAEQIKGDKEKDERPLSSREIIEQLESFPFGNGKKVVALNKPEKFSLEERNNLSYYITEIPKNSILILMLTLKGKATTGGLLGTKLDKSLKNCGSGLNCSISSSDMPKWITQKTAELTGKNMGYEESKYLMEFTGIDLRQIINELGKVASFIEPGFRITKEAIEQCCHRQTQAGVFELTDAVSIGQTWRALAIFSNLMKQQEEPLKLLALLSNHFTLIKQVKELQNKKISSNDIISNFQQMGEHPFRIQKALNVRHFTPGGLRKAQKWLMEADISIKTGRQTPEIVMEMLIILLSQEAKKR
jgi:DNA polymerase-3 subunit delta